MKHSVHRSAAFLLLTLLTSGLCAGEKLLLGIYPDMRTFKLERPVGFQPLKMSDLKVNPDRIRALGELRTVPYTTDQLVQAANFFRDDPAGRDTWRRQNAAHVLKYVNSWSLPPANLPAYQLRWLGLERIAETWLFTGNPQIGKFVHDYAVHGMTLDRWFWMGQTYRNWLKDDVKKRYADLNTLQFARTLNLLLVRCRDLFTAEEIAQMEAKYREFVLESAYEDLQRRRKWQANNWSAILSGALLLSAKYFNDTEKAAFAVETLTNYFQSSFEPDGSYGEGVGYAGYAMSVLPDVLPYLTAAERETLFRTSPLHLVTRWMVHHDFCNPEKYARIAFCDDNSFALPPVAVMYVLALESGDSAAAYLGSRTKWRAPWWNWNAASYLLGGGKDPEVKSPDALNLPLTAQFASGELIARSGWKAGDTVFGCYFNVPTKVSAHKRRESGNFVFGYNGFPIVVHSGNTNLYRRPIHQLSIRTSAANTVTVDGADQLPVKQQNCATLEFRDDPEMLLLRKDMRSAYSQPMKTMIRTFAWLKKQNRLVVMDQMSSEKGTFEFRAHLHLNNMRHDASLKKLTEKSFHYVHPKAELRIQTNAPCTVSSGYTVSDIGSIWNEKLQQAEADRGNTFVLSYGPAGKCVSAAFFAVLGKTAASVKESPEGVTVDGVLIPWYSGK
ncbi:heparinase II/III family protein [bacterium]|nr:heparinase II/III family protein [bacterium]